MKHLLQCTLLVLVLFLVPGGARAAEPFREITAVELREMLRGSDPPVVVDTRSPAEYAEAHIGGAISLPFGDLNNNPGLLRYSPDRAIVFYCNGFT